jgi:UDP-N-acetyl-D-glucosamine dehydrogenase
MKIVVVGQGYVGLPIALAAAESGYTVIGFDLNEKLVKNLNSGISHIEDIESDRLASLLKDKAYSATYDSDSIRDCDVAVIAVPTPLDSNREPDLSFVISAAEILGKNLIKSALIINESTSYPGTLRNVIAPIVNKLKSATANHMFAISPERVDPGNLKWQVANTPRLYSGLTPDASRATREFYEKFCSNLVEVSTPEVAESAKLFENTFRQVNIALVNEFAVIMRAMNIPVHEVLDAASTKPYGFMKFVPGIGVGGHCIPVDPNYLAFAANKVGVESKFINLANQVNLEMPKLLLQRIAKEIKSDLKYKKVLICGVAYKANISDTRESPSEILYHELEGLGAQVSWYDPNVHTWIGGSGLNQVVEKFDVSIIAQIHDSMDLKLLTSSAEFVFDCTNKLAGSIQL